MKIGVVSDTHSFDIPGQLIKDFKRVDLIIHAGDFCALDDYKIFKKMGSLKAVYGNMDEPALKQQLPRKVVFNVEGISIGLFHGDGGSSDVLTTTQKEFSKEDVDLAVFGHSHQAFNKAINGRHYFNPGSPNDMVRCDICTYGLIDIKGKEIKAEIIKVN